MKHAIGYLRVSGAGQVDKDGEQRQKEAVIAFCSAHGLLILSLDFEAGVSGTVDGMDRPIFADIIARIEKIDADWDAAKPDNSAVANVDFGGEAKKANRPCIVVERMDRLARDLMVQEFLLRECRNRGIEVYAADQGQLIDLASNELDPTRKLFRQIMGALAEWEKSALVLKLRKARDRKRAISGRCEGMVPYAQTEDGKAALAKVKEFRAAGYSYAETAHRMNLGKHKTRFGRLWTKKAVIKILQSEPKGQQ
jgi:DNA invertase Pin-like site-specific DNA recombinase